MLKTHNIAIIGLGYVGLPLAIEFSKKYNTIGYDIDKKRIQELLNGYDKTKEINVKNLKLAISKRNTSSKNSFFPTSNPNDLKACNIYIITVPTPTDKIHRPVLKPLLLATEIVSKYIDKDDIIIYESTVYPGVTEEECIPVIEKISGLKFNVDFFVGYSPERINPGDKKRTITKIKKITSGSNEKTAKEVDYIYNQIIDAGTYLAPSIKVAEAAKVIENCQRDINIAFVNELSKIFNLLEIDTHEVLKAADTKWNFLPFKPGLVGGHCIGIDPYYLAQKAQEVGYHPEIILSGRRLNDSMGIYVANQVVKIMANKSMKIKNSEILILGITFKENCPDVRNTKVIDIINNLKEFGANVSVHDPQASIKEVEHEFGIKLLKNINKKYDTVILAVCHDEFNGYNIDDFRKVKSVLYDVKGNLNGSDINRL